MGGHPRKCKAATRRRLQTTDGTAHAPNRTFGPGGLQANFLTADAPDQQLEASLAATDGAGLLDAVKQRWAQQVVPPTLQARVLESLAQRTDVTVLGTTTDRANRPGIAVSADDLRNSPHERVILVFSPATGFLLDVETVVLEKSDLQVKAPGTISYTVWVSTGYTTDTATHS